jgi:methylmalonyl-CoA mutase
MSEKNIKLFADFPPVTTEEWEAKINADLKGKDYERALVWKTNEGFNVRPYYRQDNLEELGHTDILPGQFPYVRGTKSDNNWFIRQDIVVDDFTSANKKALDLLGKGINSLGFVFKSCDSFSKSDAEVLLKDIYLDSVEINFVCCCNKSECAKALTDYINDGNWNTSKIKASVNIDPIGDFTLKGKFTAEEQVAFPKLKTLIEETQDIKGLQVITVAGKNFNNAGSSIVQELAFSLAEGAEYLTKLTEAGLDAGVAARKIKFSFGVGGNYFMELAKLRAGRMLWAQIVKAYNPTCNCEKGCCDDKGCCKDSVCECAGIMNVHSETSAWNKTVYDPYVNMLRTQTEAMSAALGGTDSLTVLPFHSIYETPTDFSERIARNQQILLKEESYFDKIADPAAGSYYIETLTASIAEEAWKLFLEVQEKGGFIAAFREGFVQAQVKEIANKRKKNVATRRENILGTNQFPNFTESIDSDLADQILNIEDKTVEGAEAETLKLFRGSQVFEALRFATDNYSKKSKRPKAYMLTIGNLTMRKARAQFACNFFAVAGYEVVDNNGFASIEEGVKAAKEAGADIVVICSSDDEYVELAPAAFKQLGSDSILVVAGAPACSDELRAKGIENFINVKTNLLEALKEYNAKLGIGV